MFLPASNGKPAIFAGSNLDRVVLDFPTNPLVGPRSHEPAMKIERQPLLAAVAIAILYLVLAVACARTLMPWCDEAWFSSPALNLVMHGQMGTPVLDPTAVWNSRDLTLIDRYTYWITPLYPFSESFWMRVFEFSLLTVRLYSVMWGLVALAAWWLVVRKLTANAAAAFLTAALLAVDFTFLWGASVGRMDMMCEALGISGIATFLCLREKNFSNAVLLSHASVAAAGLVHPMALGAWAALVALTLFFDFARIRRSTFGLAVIPYVVGAAAWGAYIAQNPAVFWIQFRGNATNRFVSGSLIPWLWAQTIERYLYMFGLSPDTRGISHAKIVILAAYVVGLAGALIGARIPANRGYRALFLMWAAAAIAMSLADKAVQHFYLIHFLTPVIAIFAVWLHSSWTKGTVPRWALAGLVSALLCVQLMVTGSRIAQDAYRNHYRTATAFLKQHAGPTDLIFGSAELGFDLGFFESRLVDDYRLGFISGKKAAFIVLDENRYQEWIPNLKQAEPAAYSYIANLLEHEFSLAYQNPAYKIYTRNTNAPGAVSQ